jgi:NAD(P)-dependent dehydrogenase (short-subunit alcohol dehydrogenase family)
MPSDYKRKQQFRYCADAMAHVWLITGSARGLGRAIAEGVLAADDKLIATARDPQQLSDLVERYGDNVRAVALDVTDERQAVGLDVTQPQQRIAAVERAQAHFGGIDVLVNSAGIDFPGAVEGQREEDCRAQFEVNFFGAVAMLRSLLGTSYSSRQMGYDLRRLTRKGLVARLHQKRYVLTPFGQRVALFSHQGPRPSRAYASRLSAARQRRPLVRRLSRLSTRGKVGSPCPE